MYVEDLLAWLSPALYKGIPLWLCLVSAGLRMFEYTAKAVWKEGWKRRQAGTEIGVSDLDLHWRFLNIKVLRALPPPPPAWGCLQVCLLLLRVGPSLVLQRSRL